MSWPAVILFAAASAVLSFIFLVLPVFKDTSFERMGVTFEAWIFLAVIIMSNCKKPLESALKTFVFFLISQPLIYLLQVPFSWLGWGIFQYYRYWFMWTLLTLPMAYIGWYIKKKNWLSVLIFAPVLAFLGYTACVCGDACIRSFPHLLIAALFCVFQIVLYVYVFFPDVMQKIVGILIPAAAAVVIALYAPQTDLQCTEPLPGNPSFSEEAAVEVDDSSICTAALHSAEEGIIYLYAHKHGVTEMAIRDGETEVRYSIEIYNDHGTDRIDITLIEPETE